MEVIFNRKEVFLSSKEAMKKCSEGQITLSVGVPTHRNKGGTNIECRMSNTEYQIAFISTF